MGLRLLLLLSALLLSACAQLDGRSLKPGISVAADVSRRMGQPAIRWEEPDGHQQWVYPTGPMGYHTWMVYLAPDYRLLRLENALEPRHFARIQPGMTPEQVLRILGPSVPAWTTYYQARDELVWEWRYCDDWAEPARFYVLFDRSRQTVRSTMSQTETLALPFNRFRDFCSR